MHRRGHGYITPHADGHAELAAFLERASRLKKHFQDVLYLDVEAYFVDSRVRNYTGVVAACLAAFMWLSFTLLPHRAGHARRHRPRHLRIRVRHRLRDQAIASRS